MESVAELNYLSFEDARDIVSIMDFKSHTQFEEWKKKDKLNLDIPLKPDRVYKYKGWISWPNFLGKDREVFNVEWAPIEVAKNSFSHSK